jgi:hypothetical protein
MTSPRMLHCSFPALGSSQWIDLVLVFDCRMPLSSGDFTLCGPRSGRLLVMHRVVRDDVVDLDGSVVQDGNPASELSLVVVARLWYV